MGRILIDNADETISVDHQNKTTTIDNLGAADPDGPITRTHDGRPIPFGRKEPEVDEVEQEKLRLEAERDDFERQAKVAKAERNAERSFREAAQDEATNLRKKLDVIENEGKLPTYVEVLTVDGIERDGTAAILHCTADVDGTIGDTNVIVPVEQIKEAIRKARDAEQNDRIPPHLRQRA